MVLLTLRTPLEQLFKEYGVLHLAQHLWVFALLLRVAILMIHKSFAFKFLDKDTPCKQSFIYKTTES